MVRYVFRLSLPKVGVLLTLMLRIKSVRHGLSRWSLSSISGSWPLLFSLFLDNRPPRGASKTAKFTMMSSLINQNSSTEVESQRRTPFRKDFGLAENRFAQNFNHSIV
jgi:hypothetical protein